MSENERGKYIPGQNQIEEATEIDKVVEDKLKRAKTRGADEIAHEVVKDKVSRRIDIHRLLPEEQLWYENLQDAGVNILNDGFLEITRWERSTKKKPVPVHQKVDGVNSAIRMQEHILKNYSSGEESELDQIESVQEVIEYCNELLNRWSKATPEEKKDLQEQLTSVVLQLEKCRNEFKVVVRGQAEKVVDLKDSKGRENPGAFAARTVSALHNLSKRFNELQLIMPAMAFRKESLVLEKRRINDVIKRTAAHLTGILHHSVFHESSKDPSARINDNELPELDKRIGKSLNLIGQVHVLPYSAQARQAEFAILKVKKYFDSKRKLLDNLPAAKQGLEEAIQILKSDIEELD